MFEEILNLAISNGIWAVLFLLLLIYQLKDSKNREIKYQNTIESLGNSFETLKDVQDDVKEIKEKMCYIKIPKQKKTIKDEDNEIPK